MSKETFKRAVAAARDGTPVPVMQLTRDNPQAAAVMSKLVTAPHQAPNFGPGGKREVLAPDITQMKSLADRTAQNINDSETVMQILPDMELAKEILVSSIISPKDMVTTELNHIGAEGLMSADLTATCVEKIQQHMDTTYKIKSQMAEMLRDILFTTGSYVIAVIPENAIDEAINGSGRVGLESLKESFDSDGSIRSIGLLGAPHAASPRATPAKPGLSLEAFSAYDPGKEFDTRVRLAAENNGDPVDTYITVLDNPDILKIPNLNRKIREERISRLVKSNVAMEKATGIGANAMESIEKLKLTDRDMAAKLFKNPTYGYRPIATIKTQEQLNRTSVGSPLVIHIPSEAVIPVHVPGHPEEQIGYFVLLDAEGNPISKMTNTDHYRQLSNRFNSQDNFSSTMLKKVNAQMNGTFDQRNPYHLDVSTRIFGDLIEQDMLARLRNGVYGNGLEIARQDDVYRIMLARAMAKQHTQMLFLPIELTTYFAFRYNDDGIGKSILEETKILSSLRAMMLFSNVMASMKNSIGRTEVTMTFDEEDPDPMKSFEEAIHEFMRTRQQAFPLGMNSPSDITDWMARAGYEFIPEGNPRMPAMKIGINEKASNYVKPDDELAETLRKYHIMAFGISPESVDAAFSAEFATTVVSNNLLLAKRATHYSERFEVPLSEHHRKLIRNSQGLLTELSDILMNGFDKIKQDMLKGPDGEDIVFTEEGGDLKKRLIVNQVLEQFIRGYRVELPKPNSATLTSQLDALKIYMEGLDVAVDAWINSEFLTNETVGDVSNQVDMLKSAVKNHFIRQWMAENGVMTELAQLTAQDEQGKPMLDLFAITKEHFTSISKSLTGLMMGLQPMIKATNQILQDVQNDGAGGEATQTDDNQGGGEGGEGGGGDNFEEFSMDDAAGGGMPDENTDAPLDDEPTDAEPKDDAKKDDDDKKDDAEKKDDDKKSDDAAE